MARLPIVAGLLTASLMTQAAMPEWMNKVGEYCTVEACKEGLKNAAEFATANGKKLKELVVSHPYITAAVVAGTTGVGYAATKYRNARQQRKQELEQAEEAVRLVEQLLQDEQFAQMLEDEEFARQLHNQLNGHAPVQVQRVDTAADEALALALYHELQAAMAQMQREQQQDAVYAQSLVEAY